MKVESMHDIHTHLYWHTYDADRDVVVARAREAGVEKMFVIGCTIEESRQAVALTKQYSGLYAAVGIHPQEYTGPLTDEVLQEQITVLRELATDEKVVAIGECGLEYYAHDPEKPVTQEQKAAQKQGFQAQIALAQELQLPLILHCRAESGRSDAYEDMLAMLQASPVMLPTILHCYMGDTEVTKQFLALPNTHFSFTGNITYPVKKAVAGTKDDLTETVKLIPLDRIFTETDCPFLTPQAHRGERNEPAYVSEVVGKVAELQGVTVEQVVQATEENFRKVFSKAA